MRLCGPIYRPKGAIYRAKGTRIQDYRARFAGKGGPIPGIGPNTPDIAGKRAINAHIWGIVIPYLGPFVNDRHPNTGASYPQIGTRNRIYQRCLLCHNGKKEQ